MHDWPDLRKLNMNEWMRRKSCRDEKWPKLSCLRSLHIHMQCDNSFALSLIFNLIFNSLLSILDSSFLVLHLLFK